VTIARCAHEACEDRDVKLHRTGRIEQRDQAERIRLAAPEGEIDRLAGRDPAARRCPQIEAPAASLRASPLKPFGKLLEPISRLTEQCRSL